MGEVARAYIVPEAEALLDEGGVIAWSREQMANYKVPRSVALVTELPLNAGGKVDKLALADRARGELA